MTYDINFLLIIHIFCVDFYVDTEHLIFYFVKIYMIVVCNVESARLSLAIINIMFVISEQF